MPQKEPHPLALNVANAVRDLCSLLKSFFSNIEERDRLIDMVLRYSGISSDQGKVVFTASQRKPVVGAGFRIQAAAMAVENIHALLASLPVDDVPEALRHSGIIATRNGFLSSDAPEKPPSSKAICQSHREGDPHHALCYLRSLVKANRITSEQAKVISQRLVFRLTPNSAHDIRWLETQRLVEEDYDGWLAFLTTNRISTPLEF